ncbi:hypothetical protein ABIF65_004271 [Bradyrhizobium japonicum]|jgi:hypothetical protein|nr:hypothetical protein [Bradyrhizobium japonicum]MCP1860296.1 hypothetical protein [Bradyrhizobium japonicum]MCW2324097.1 hypothetical protein [Bradyrhizobium japonicum]
MPRLPTGWRASRRWWLIQNTPAMMKLSARPASLPE